MADILILFGSGFFILVGVLIFCFAISLSQKKKKMQHWTKTIATVKTAELKSSTSGMGSDRSTMYSPVISYKYKFNGKSFEYENSEFGSSNRSEVENILNKYEKGSEIEILVDPQNPDKSGIFELSTQPNFIIYFMMGFGVVFVGAGILVYLVFGSFDLFGPPTDAPSNSSFDIILDLLGPLFAFSVGAIFAYIGYYLHKKGDIIIKTWKMVEAQVVSSSIITKSESKRSNGRSFEEIMFAPLIRYKYTYEGKKYSGEDSSTYSSSELEAQNLMNQNPEGSSVPIYVNPTNPNESSLKNSGNTKDMIAYAFMVIGVLAMLMAILLFLFSFF